MMFTILLVLFVMIMAAWAAANLGWVAPQAAPWLAWAACFDLGLVVFLVGTGLVVAERLR